VIGAVVAATFALSASPSRVELGGGGTRIVYVRNRGNARVELDAARAGFALDLSGRPRVIATAPAAWLSVRPRRLAIPPGGTGKLFVAGRVPPRASPGDHTALLLLATHAAKNAGVAVRMRLGLTVVLRVPGPVIHRLAVERVRVAGGQVRVTVANRGNVTEQLTGRRVLVTVRRGTRVLARLTPASRELLPHSRGILVLRLRGPTSRATVVEVAIRSVSGEPSRSRRFAVAPGR
jgi:hypothetical protein